MRLEETSSILQEEKQKNRVTFRESLAAINLTKDQLRLNERELLSELQILRKFVEATERP